MQLPYGRKGFQFRFIGMHWVKTTIMQIQRKPQRSTIVAFVALWKVSNALRAVKLFGSQYKCSPHSSEKTGNLPRRR